MTGDDAGRRRHDLDGFDAVVYDLDGTLVRLAVDWDRAAREAAAALADLDGDGDPNDLWATLDRADARGPEARAAVEAVVCRHERAGARESARLPLADDLLARAEGVALGVCSLNAEEPVRLALATHGLADAVDAVVGRDTIPERKPDPAPLRETLARLGADAERAVFVGDSGRDAVAAERAGVAFRYVDDGPSGA